MRLFWGILLAGLLAGQARGQAFERGYLVTTAGDTLRGELENRFWQAPPENVLYRRAAGEAVTLYPKARIRSFRLEAGRYFRAEVVPLDRGAQTQVNNLPQRLVINQQPDSLLVEVLVDGPAPLLRAVVDGVSHYFVRRPGGPFLELADRKYLAVANGSQRVVDANNYRGLLTVYFGDCPAASATAGTAAFSAKGLATVVQAFNVQCTEGKQLGADLTTPTRAHRPFAFNGGLLVGIGYNHERFNSNETGEEAPLLNSLNLDGRLHPVAGAYLDVLLPGRRWVAHTELAYSTFGRKGTFPLAGGAGAYTWYGTRLDARLGARYMLKQALQREWFAGAGFDFNNTLSYESREQYGTGGTRLTQGGVRVPTEAAFVGRPAFGVAPYLEAGVRQGRFTLSLDAMLGDGAGYNDPLTVEHAVRDANNVPLRYSGYNYSALLLAYRAVLGFRLGRRPDQHMAH